MADIPSDTPTASGSGLLAVVTGASSGIGYELARGCAQRGHDLIIAADEPQIEIAAAQLRDEGAAVTPVMADLSTAAGIRQLCDAIGERRVDVLCANAGRGLGHAFLDQDFADIQHVVETNVTGTLHLLHRLGQRMREQRSGRILITGSIAGFMPGTYQAVYNATKAFLDSFSYALRHELQGSGVTVTCLMPGATETEFFERADLLDTKIGQQKKADPAEVARIGLEAMMRAEGEVITGWQNKLRAAISMVTPADVLAEQHRRMAQPRSEVEERLPDEEPPAGKPPAV